MNNASRMVNATRSNHLLMPGKLFSALNIISQTGVFARKQIK
jgi:hypothetical protein